MKLNICRTQSREASGFTLLEMAFVLLVMGIVVSMLIPTMSGVHRKSMVEEDRRILSDLRDVLIGQFLATGKLPLCVARPGPPAPNPLGQYCDTQSSIGNLAVRTTDSRNVDIKYDVWNDASSDLTATDLSTVCATLSAVINANSAPTSLPITSGGVGPAVCSTAPDYNQYPPGSGASNYCTTARKVAFVLVGSGATRPENNSKENSSWTSDAPGNRNIGIDRVFENIGRRHSERWRYDDLMEVVTFEQLSATLKCPIH